MKILSNKKYELLCSIISDQAHNIEVLENTNQDLQEQIDALRALTKAQDLSFPNSKERGFEDPNKIFFM